MIIKVLKYKVTTREDDRKLYVIKQSDYTKETAEMLHYYFKALSSIP